MDKYIIELLDTNTRVIIPDFGAFIIKQKDPRLIVFNEFLRYNDGLLIEFVAKSENIDKVLAKKKVVEYVDLANKNLKDKNEHIIEGLGKLIKESTGKITFEEIPGVQAKESKKKEPKKSAEIKEEKKAKADEAVPEKPEVPKTEKEPPKIKEEKPVEKKEAATPAKEESKKEITAKPKEEPVAKPKAEPPVKPKAEPVAKEKEESILRPKAEHKPEPPYKTAEIKRKKKNNAQIVLWIILILVINAAIISWFVFKDEYRGFFKRLSGTTDVLEEETADQGLEIITETEDVSPGSEAGIEEPAADIQSQKIAEPEVAPEIEEEPVSYPVKRYYIVAGCFREENNATAYVKKLIQKGYDAEKFAKIGNLHYVSYSSFIDKSEAQSQLRKIREEEQPEAWMLYH
jgi:nucleoid DNA-binding protein